MIDFHCHLDLFSRPDMAATEAERAGIYVLSVTNTPKAFPKTSQIAKARRRMRTALGLHPQLVRERHDEVSLFVRLLGETQYVGEIGIDGGEEYAGHLDIQREVFERILRACAAEGGRVMSIHSRHASSEVVDCLRRWPTAGTPILHWFTGSKRDAEAAIALGAWFSVGTPMLKSKRMSEIVATLPRDRILTETDAPFVSTKGSAYPVEALREAVFRLSELWRCAPEQADAQLRSNLSRLVKTAADAGV